MKFLKVLPILPGEGLLGLGVYCGGRFVGYGEGEMGFLAHANIHLYRPVYLEFAGNYNSRIRVSRELFIFRNSLYVGKH